MANRKYAVPDDKNYDVFRSRLKSLMDSHGYNMKELAAALHLNSATISRYLSERGPDLFSIWRIADLFDCSIDWLIGRKESRFETFPPNITKVANLYSVATESDKLVIDTLLKKYDV